LSLWRPWPWAFFEPVPPRARKTIENRSKPPPRALLGHDLGIHAAKRWDNGGDTDITFALMDLGAPEANAHRPDSESFEPGIWGLVRVVGWIEVDADLQLLRSETIDEVGPEVIARALRSPWLSGPFGWLVDRPRKLTEPVEIGGRQTLGWVVPPAVAAEVYRRLPGAEEGER